MAPVDTPATILTTIAYGETSKIARLATRDLGVVSVIAKGARRPRSRFGAALQRLSEGVATIVPARSSDLHTLAGFELRKLRAGLATSVDRYAAASVLAELMLQCSPQDGPPETYAFFHHAIDLLEAAPAEAVGVLGLRTIWGLVKQLGFAPSLERCVRDGTLVAAAAPVAFSAALGGVLCPRCAPGVEATRLAPTDRLDLGTLVHGNDDLPLLAPRYLAAHRRLLDHYIRHHLAEGAALPAVVFWSEQAWARRPA
jgi:DNA repair protein RecO (recombination protein O)